MTTNDPNHDHLERRPPLCDMCDPAPPKEEWPLYGARPLWVCRNCWIVLRGVAVVGGAPPKPQKRQPPVRSLPDGDPANLDDQKTRNR